jgi:general secretion pathway protein J
MIIHKKIESGFTLIEILVAFFVFGFMATFAYAGLNQVLTGQAQLQSSSDQLKDLQLAFRYLEKDINQLVNRPIRNQYQDLQPSFVGDEDKAMSFTHAGWRNPAYLVRSKLQRVSYELSENTIKRYTWGQLDGAIAEEFFTTELIEGVESIKMRYLQGTQWHTTWPPLNSASFQQVGIPQAIEFIIKLENMEEIRRLFAAPTAS